MPLIHYFKSVANAINDHESTFNIPSFIHLLLNYIPIVHNVVFLLFDLHIIFVNIHYLSSIIQQHSCQLFFELIIHFF